METAILCTMWLEISPVAQEFPDEDRKSENNLVTQDTEVQEK